MAISKSGKREVWIDSAKGWLIILVVVGHVLGTACNLPETGGLGKILGLIYKIIYTFHMPAFFVLAGVTWSAGNAGWMAYGLKKVKRLCVPYYVFGLLSLLIWAIVGGAATTDSGRYSVNLSIDGRALVELLLGKSCVANSPLWFLPCLFVVELLYYGIQRIWQGRWAAVLQPMIFLLLGYGAYLVADPRQADWYHCLPLYLFYFAVGRGCLRMNPYEALKCRWAWWGMGLIALWVIFCWVISVTPYHVQWQGLDAYLFYRMMALIGSILIALTCQLKPMPGMAAVGAASIGILVLHKLPVVGIMLLSRKFMSGYGEIGVIILCVGTLLMSLAIGIVGYKVLVRFAPWMFGMKRVEAKK